MRTSSVKGPASIEVGFLLSSIVSVNLLWLVQTFCIQSVREKTGVDLSIFEIIFLSQRQDERIAL